MWQVWQVGAAEVSVSTFSCFRAERTPCLDEEYISHWGWSKPMWQVSQACGCLASATEKVWRGWQASQEAMPKVLPCARRSAISLSVLSPILWQAPQPFMPSISAMG